MYSITTSNINPINNFASSIWPRLLVFISLLALASFSSLGKAAQVTKQQAQSNDVVPNLIQPSTRPASAAEHLLPGDLILLVGHAKRMEPAPMRKTTSVRDIYNAELSNDPIDVRVVMEVAQLTKRQICSTSQRCVDYEDIDELHALRMQEDEQLHWVEILLDAITSARMPHIQFSDFRFEPSYRNRWNYLANTEYAVANAQGTAAADSLKIGSLGGRVLNYGGQPLAGLADKGIEVSLGDLGRSLSIEGLSLSGVELSNALGGLASGLGGLLSGIGSVALGGIGGGLGGGLSLGGGLGGGPINPAWLSLLLLLAMKRQLAGQTKSSS